VHHRAKLNEEKVRKIRKLHAEGVRQIELAQRYGVTQQTISHIIGRRTWRKATDPTIVDIRREVARMVKRRIIEDGDMAKTAIVMLAAAIIGQEIQALSDFTGIPEAFIQERAERLIENGVWKDGKIYADWFGKDGTIAFVLDVMVAEGEIVRVPAEEGKRSDGKPGHQMV
jgi:hypothetical protein